jgi:DNA primase
MNDIERLRRETSLSELAMREGITLQKNGNEWEGCCPFHQETTPSFTIFNGKDGVPRFFCFGCNERGDVIDFVEKLKGMQKRDAINYLGGGQSAPNVAPRQVQARDVYEGIVLLQPTHGIRPGVVVRVYNPKRAEDKDRRWGSFAPEAVYPYYNPDGTPLGYVLRHKLRDGSKETPMVCWVKLPSGEECWARFPFPRPRPLYRREALKEGQVIIVEGEKCADKLAKHTGRQTLSWCGGTFGINHTDWSPLAGRSVVIWPDADGPGLDTANKVAAMLTNIGCTVRVLKVDQAA